MYSTVSQNLQNAMEHIEEIMEKIAYLEIEEGIFLDDVDHFIETKVNFNHVKVRF